MRVGTFEFDARRRELRDASGRALPLTSKAIDVLAILVRERGRTVGKRELMAEVWPRRVLEDNNLSQAIAALRRAFGAGTPDHAFIVTVPGVGYRLVAEVVDSGEEGCRSLAVLPIQVCGGLARRWVDDLGLSEALVTTLARRLRMAVRSVDALEGPGATHALEGSLHPVGTAVRVTLRLLSRADGLAIWSQVVDVPRDAALALHESVAEHIARVFSTETPWTAGHAGGVGQRAFHAYLVGRYLMNRPDPSRLPEAVASFQDAIDLDPTYARAYAALAFAYRAWCITGDRAPLEVFPLARAAVEQALAIDPGLAEALAQKGFIQFWHGWDWPGAEATLRQAVAADPNLAEARFALAHLLVNLRRFDEAIAQIALAGELDPLSPIIATLHAAFLGYAGELGEARTRALRAIELAPRFPPAWLHLGQVEVDRGDLGAAVEALETGARMTTSTQLMAMLGVAYAGAGRVDDAEAVLGQLRARTADGYVPPTSLGAIEAALGRAHVALDLLEEAERVRDVRLAFIAIDSRWKPLHRMARFRALAGRMRLPVA